MKPDVRKGQWAGLHSREEFRERGWTGWAS